MSDKVAIDELFDAIGHAGHDIAQAIRDGNDEVGEGASSALCNALAMLPSTLRTTLVEALTDRSGLAPHLREMAL